MVSYTKYLDPTDTSRHFSPIIWDQCPSSEELKYGPRSGVEIYDRFHNTPDHAAAIGTGMYDSYIDTGVIMGAITDSVTVPGRGGVGGGFMWTGNDADNDEGVISGHCPAFEISGTAARKRKLMFEAVVAKASIADNALAMFCGLGWDFGNGISVAKTTCLVDDTGALGDFSFLGFHVDHAAGEVMDVVYRSDSGAQTVLIAGLQTMVVNTWYKIGFVYDPDRPEAQRIRFYLNGAEQNTYITETLIDAAAFPDDEAMAPCCAYKTGATAAVRGYLRQWRCVQYDPDP